MSYAYGWQRSTAHHVSAVLGHSNVTTTVNMYYRSNEDDKRKAIELLERSL
jgi:integrase